MNLAITGSSGLIGTAVTQYFYDRQCQVTRICRESTKDQSGSSIVHWDVPSQTIDTSNLEAVDVVIHLAGANIAARRWSTHYKSEILKSRVEGTGLLCRSLAQLKNPPKVLVSASAVGFYGIQESSNPLDELSLRGDGFLSDVCAQWEAATQPALDAGVRIVHLRFGMVLSTRGGALAKMLPPFRFGLGGPMGCGRQMISWVALEEIPPILAHIISHDHIRGAVNVVSPQAVSNLEFTKTLGRVIHRPTIFPIPSFGVKLLFGEMGETLLCGGQNVMPKKLIDDGYDFQYASLEQALKACLLNGY